LLSVNVGTCATVMAGAAVDSASALPALGTYMGGKFSIYLLVSV
jgi:hypothetical protein